jgi:outer membrane protein OmpA-like peptidoglycan-associated protein
MVSEGAGDLPALILMAAEPSAPLSEDSLEKKITEEKVTAPPPPPVAMAEASKAIPAPEEPSRNSAPSANAVKTRTGLQKIPSSVSMKGPMASPSPRLLAESHVEKVMIQVMAADLEKGIVAALQNQAKSLQTDENGYYFYYRLKGENTSWNLSAVGYQSQSLQVKSGMNAIELLPGASFSTLPQRSKMILLPPIEPALPTSPQPIVIPKGAFWLAMDMVDQESGLHIEGLLTLTTVSESLQYKPKGSIDLALAPQQQAYMLEVSAPGYKSRVLDINRPGVLRIELSPAGMGALTAKSLMKATSTQPKWQLPAPESKTIRPSNALFSLSLYSEDTSILPQGRLQNPRKEEPMEWEQKANTWVSTQKPERLKVLAAGHFPQWIEAESWSANPHQEMVLTPIRAGENFVLSRLVFEQGTINFSDSTVIEELDRLVDMMQSTEELEILLTGYTDNQGIVRENMELSRERADAVKAYLVSKGIPQERIETQGLGPSNPIASNANPETRALNRRVECTIVKASD